MTPQEREMLAELFERIRSVAANPRDAEAEAFIAEATRQQPYAPYVLAQTALVQLHALDAAGQRIQELEGRLAQASAPTSFLGGVSRSLFGAGLPAAAQREAAPASGYDAGAYQRAQQPDPSPPRPQAYAPPPTGPWGAPPAAAAGGGFLASAATTATGVAGGMLAASAIEHLLLGGRGGLFGGPAGLYGGGLGAGGLGGETTVNNFYDSTPADAASTDRGSEQEASFDSANFDPGGGFDDGGGFDNGGGGVDV